MLFELEGVRGRHIAIYDRKCVISTKPGVGSFLTGNVTDGEKTIFYTDVVGLQFKKSGSLIGYLIGLYALVGVVLSILVFCKVIK